MRLLLNWYKINRSDRCIYSGIINDLWILSDLFSVAPPCSCPPPYHGGGVWAVEWSSALRCPGLMPLVGPPKVNGSQVMSGSKEPRLTSPGPHPGARSGIRAHRRAPGGRVSSNGHSPKEQRGSSPIVGGVMWLGDGRGPGPQQHKSWMHILWLWGHGMGR